MTETSAGIVHGDIKPENVLVFKENPGKYCAKVIDFGYAARYTDGTGRLTLSGTELWNAPEHGSRARQWTLSQAIKADLFSFGMLCFWLLFEPSLSGTAPLPQDFQVADVDGSRLAEDRLRRAKVELRAYAQKLLTSVTTLENLEQDKKIVLGEFFDSRLSQNPEEREMSLLTLLEKLDSQR